MEKKRAFYYLAITFLITWGCWWTLAFLTQYAGVTADRWLYKGLHMLGGFGPTIAAILVLPKRTPKEILRFVFGCRKKSLWVLLLYCALQVLIFGLSAREVRPDLPWFAIPFVFLSVTIIGGGNEELGWRGILQPALERKMAFPFATLLTGGVWMLWHVPLWFVEGTSQQSMPFLRYVLFGLILSVWLATTYRRTKSVFYCCLLHGFSNLMLSLFVVKVNWILVVSLLLSLVVSYFLLRGTEASQAEQCSPNE